MILFQKDNFIDSTTLFPKIRQLKFFDKISSKGQWPGFRTKDLKNSCTEIFNEIKESIKKLELPFLKNTTFKMYAHVRLKKDNQNDFIHTDTANNTIYSGLIYLNKTNLDSATLFYDEKDNIIHGVKYVQDRLVIFSSAYRHMSFNNFGDDIDNGRVTLNLFFKNEDSKTI